MNEENKKEKIESKTSPHASHPPETSGLLNYKINKWFSVSRWKWCANDDDCGICRNAFETCCSDCKLPGDDCPLVWGQCNHCYHMHCIVKWLNSQQVAQHCPLCRQEWRFRE